MAAANDLRPVQARGNLERMMERQLEIRREETKAIHTKCDELEKELKDLRTAALEMATAPSAASALRRDQVSREVVTNEDMLRWAEAVP